MTQEFKYPFQLPNDYKVGGIKNFDNGASKKKLPKLFEPLIIKDLELKNRIVVSPMCMYTSTDGYMNDFHLVHYAQFARGGAGLVMVEASAVTEEGRISFGDVGIYKDEHLDGLKRVVNFIHSHNTKVGIQLAHAGRKASTKPMFLPDSRKTISPDEGGWEFYGPTEEPYLSNSKYLPQPLTTEQIYDIIKSFGIAAGRALEAGFDVIDIHSAHGYLLDSFLSPLSNKRTDEFGGSFEGRIKLLLEVIKEVRTHWPMSKPLFVRISCTEWVEGGWTIEDSVKLTQILKNQGLVDLIDCSSGGNNQNQKINTGPMYQVAFAQEVKEKSSILTSAVGMINTAQQAESILQDGKADIVMIGRQFLKDPNFGIHAAVELGIEIHVPIQYNYFSK
ncbi:NADH:flavin oxidoreductase/NADH oxidase domain-containing protein [Tieghemostelium lacteum]|uniref:NADH:flavin oxidoreductase/NADH oxidase domain-containing protein n=1 Tax=Tieghemostelium lacteum TaxID=361077 RepID=A0A151ZIJ2_TIELA|nr:NADH:flavin oxidoreductase/NADH oxidase domain-containing protein [Tieghemostelium lacteum]|eukprot:KYQ93776.1 NADH:flavin oxidoreductase/NADH oxidase domain-containing protein [Tieghemostelium lacteum]